MNNIETELQLVDHVFQVIRAGDDNIDTSWAIGIALIGGCLLRVDEMSRARLLKSLPLELKAAVEGIGAMVRGPQQPYPETPPVMH
jgi:hypothetical protein